jgi:hypothetical protein
MKNNQVSSGWLLRRAEERQRHGEGASEKGLALKDFKHVTPALEHLVALEVLERERKSGRKAKWLYRKAERFKERVVIVKMSKERPERSQSNP